MPDFIRIIRNCTAAALLLATGAVSSAVHAESVEGLDLVTQSNKSALAVSPAIVEQVLTPGGTTSYKLNVSNLTNFPLPISGTVQSFTSLEDIVDVRKRQLYDASKWFVISEPDFILQPRQIREVTVTISPPRGSEPGGHYATVYFQPLLPEGALTPSTAYLSARVGSLAFLIMPGKLDERISVREFAAPYLDSSGPVPFTLQLENTGNVHLSPNSKLTVYDWLHKKTAEVTLNSGVILPGTKKTYTGSWEKPSGFGRYTATLTTKYGASKLTASTRTVTFWVLPVQNIILAIATVGLVITGYRTKGRWKRAWSILRGKDAGK